MVALTALRLQWELTVGRYRGVLVRTEELRLRCQALLDTVRQRELARDHYEMDAPPVVSGQESDDGLVAVLDNKTGQVVGTLRATRMSLVVRDRSIAPDFQFDARLLGDRIDTTFLCHHLAVLPSHRKTAASLVLMSTVYGLGVEKRGNMCLVDCEPPLARIYRRLGFLPVGRPYTRDGLVFIAMILVNNDAEHLRAVRSPLLRTWRSMGRPRDPEGQSWLAQAKAAGHIPSQHFEYVRATEAVEGPLFVGLSKSARAGLLSNATRMSLAPGQTVLRRGGPGRWLGVVEDGQLECRVDGRLVAELTEGDPVGLVSYVRRSLRAADVVVGPTGATLLMLTPSAFARVRRARDKAQLSANAAQLMANRLVEGG